jgi:hypothetical protein
MAAVCGQQPQSDRAGDQSRVVEAPITGIVLGFGEELQSKGHDQHRHRKIHHEDPAPGETGGEPAAEQRPDGGRAGHHRPPNAEGHRPLAAPEGRIQAGEGGRQHHRSPNSLDAPSPDQFVGIHRGGGGEAGSGEDHHPHQEHQPTTVDVAQPAEGEQQRCEHHRVEAGDPLRLVQGQVELIDDRRQRHPEDGSVQDDHRQSGGQGGKTPPAPIRWSFHINGGHAHLLRPDQLDPEDRDSTKCGWWQRVRLDRCHQP